MKCKRVKLTQVNERFSLVTSPGDDHVLWHCDICCTAEGNSCVNCMIHHEGKLEAIKQKAFFNKINEMKY